MEEISCGVIVATRYDQNIVIVLDRNNDQFNFEMSNEELSSGAYRLGNVLFYLLIRKEIDGCHERLYRRLSVVDCPQLKYAVSPYVERERDLEIISFFWDGYYKHFTLTRCHDVKAKLDELFIQFVEYYTETANYIRASKMLEDDECGAESNRKLLPPPSEKPHAEIEMEKRLEQEERTEIEARQKADDKRRTDEQIEAYRKFLGKALGKFKKKRKPVIGGGRRTEFRLNMILGLIIAVGGYWMYGKLADVAIEEKISPSQEKVTAEPVPVAEPVAVARIEKSSLQEREVRSRPRIVHSASSDGRIVRYSKDGREEL